jgi:hypothetical protein
MFKEFKKFALKGNLIDMSVAFVMGAAFTKLSGSFIEDLIMPIVGQISGGMDYSNKFIALSSGITANTLDQARQVRDHCDQRPDRRFRHVSGGQGDQQSQGTRRDLQRGSSSDSSGKTPRRDPRSAQIEGLELLLTENPHSGLFCWCFRGADFMLGSDFGVPFFLKLA